MRTPARIGLAAAFAIVADDASAHTVLGITGFPGGLLHPLLVPTHLLALVALGLLIGQRDWPRRAIAAYGLGLIAGLGAIAFAYVPPFGDEGLLSLAAVAGLLVAWAGPLPATSGAILAALTGLAIGLDSPPEAVSIAEANLTLLGTALSATALLVALAWIAARLRRDWQRIGLRILGSWIAASAIMVLALRWAAA